jgi:hypothetical protein
MSLITGGISDDSLIGRLLNGYVAIESAKVDQRLSANNPGAIHNPSYPNDAQANAGSYTAPGAGVTVSTGLLLLVGAGLVIWLAK